MNSFPYISHRMFLAAIGQKFPPRHVPEGPFERRKAARRQPPSKQCEIADLFIPEAVREPRVAALISSPG